MTSTADVAAFISSAFPQSRIVIRDATNRGSVVAMPVSSENLRPGGTVSGPTMMALADTALYVAILGEIGIVPLAVTTSLNINFLRRPAADKDLVATCRLLKLGRTLAVGEVAIYSDGMDEPVAHATGTYSIPPEGDGSRLGHRK